MARMNWKDGWHNYNSIEYYIENGVFVRGKIGELPVRPYLESEDGYYRVYNLKANKRNFFKIYWF